MATEGIITSGMQTEADQKKKLKQSLDFYISHLSPAELRILNNTAKSLAHEHSSSYRDYLLNS